MSDSDSSAHPAHDKVWSGRLGEPTASLVERYTEAFDIDRRLMTDDVRATRAHVAMLHAAGIVDAEEHAALEDALVKIGDEVSAGRFEFAPGDEDIHTALERRAHEIAGPVAGRMHSGRSRNDQVAAALRLYGRRICTELMRAVLALQEAMLDRAEEHRADPLPGYTHLQRAQPVTLGHHLLAHVAMLQRDAVRLQHAREACDVSPLGSGALAGSTLPMDRDAVARELGFARISANTLDAVADRDFAVDITYACALTMVHLSRLSEEIVLWCSTEFHFAGLPDSHATGSSLMPQKKNPDVAELARGRTGHVTGALVALLMTLKGLPLAYNRDLQEDKRALFTAVDVTLETLQVLAELVAVLRFDTAAMRAAAEDPALLATDVAELLVRRGVPFREAHRRVGAAVRRADARGMTLADLSAQEWQEALGSEGDGVAELFDAARSLSRRNVPGGPGRRAVDEQLRAVRAQLAASGRDLAELE